MSLTSQAAVMVGEKFEIREYPVPETEPDSVLLRMELAGICGTDLHNWEYQQLEGEVPRGKFVDQFGKLVALIGQSAPTFWLGIMLMFLFAVWLRWTPPYGKEDWNSIILPAVTLGWYYAAANLRLVRSAMLDVLDSEYIKLARAKGVSSSGVILKHGLRNALIPPLTFAGVTLGALVTGSLVVETVFAWPGLGRLAIESLFSFDYPLLQGVVITFTLMYVTAAFVVDILYAYVDPRIRYA